MQRSKRTNNQTNCINNPPPLFINMLKSRRRVLSFVFEKPRCFRLEGVWVPRTHLFHPLHGSSHWPEARTVGFFGGDIYGCFFSLERARERTTIKVCLPRHNNKTEIQITAIRELALQINEQICVGEWGLHQYCGATLGKLGTFA